MTLFIVYFSHTYATLTNLTSAWPRVSRFARSKFRSIFRGHQASDTRQPHPSTAFTAPLFHGSCGVFPLNECIYHRPPAASLSGAGETSEKSGPCHQFFLQLRVKCVCVLTSIQTETFHFSPQVGGSNSTQKMAARRKTVKRVDFVTIFLQLRVKCVCFDFHADRSFSLLATKRKQPYTENYSAEKNREKSGFCHPSSCSCE